MINYGKLGKSAAKTVACLSSDQKNAILQAMASALILHSDDILEANQIDLSLASEAGLSTALLERLTLTTEKVSAMAEGLKDVSKLPDPVGELIDAFQSPEHLNFSKVRVPLGLLMMIYESRPNVTADAAALALKSGNAIILKGGKEALHTNQKIADVLIRAGIQTGLPENAIQFINSSDREITNALLRDIDHVDVIIPRGGPALKKAIAQVAKVPILMTGAGICHLYVSKSANAAMAIAIALNAKTQRPGVCNAIETLLIHEAFPYAAELLTALSDAGVALMICPRTEDLLKSTLKNTHPATEEDYSTEYLNLTLSVKIVASTKEAIAHIGDYSTGHSESIVSEDLEDAEKFLNAVDSACVYHNASTRFTDGGCFGFGCEIGIATQKLHARGPMGLRELTGYKYQIRGSGQIRK